MLGIIGAMDEEVAQIKEKMTDVTVTSVAGMDFYQGKLGGKDAVVVRSGIGKVNAGMCSQILADRFHISAIVNRYRRFPACRDQHWRYRCIDGCGAA